MKTFYGHQKRKLIDIQPWLFNGLVLKEKVFREELKNHDENYQEEPSNDLKEFGVDSDSPDLFSSESENSSPSDLLNSEDQEDEDDLEIPAFLRRQKN